MNPVRDLPAVGSNLAPLVAALRDPARYPHPVRRIEILQTHISWVLLTGDYAYKIKKPVNPGFLDFTTLAARRHFCEEELRLNRRLAPELYLEVVAITGTEERPLVGGGGPVIEYAVKMREFAQSALLDNALARGEVTTAQIEQLARTVADFHARLPPQTPVPGHVAERSGLTAARENFAQMLPLLDRPADIAALASLRDWTLREYAAHWAQFAYRNTDGCMRECHGDLHLGNIALLDGVAVPFDCIEFSPELRCVDVMSEVAFLMMDFEAHARRDLAFTFASTYLEAGGDYDGVRLLPFYIVYRALVRAKVNLLRAVDPAATLAQRERAMAAYRRYVDLAAGHTHPTRGAVIITYGLSGAGKSTHTRYLLAALGAIRVRSDVERKRLHGLMPLARTASLPGTRIYAPDETARTYDRLLRHARSIATAGMPAIVDATFLKFVQRAVFHALASELGVPFAIVNVPATPAELRARIAERAARGDDASEATLQVLQRQLEDCEALTAGEFRHSVLASGRGAAVERAMCDALAEKLREPSVAHA